MASPSRPSVLMNKRFATDFRIHIVIVGILSFSMAGCGPSAEDKALMERASSIFGPIPEKMPGSENDTKALVELGQKLYFDKRLSANDNQSCNTCHRLDQNFAGVDNRPVSPGSFAGKKGDRNAPTVLNAGFHMAQFWDGRAADLVDQAKGPILNPAEMAMASEKDVEEKLGKIEEYRTLFSTAFPDQENPINYQNIAEAIAAFERTVITEDRFDDFMEGDASALSEQEKAGLALFMDAGCIQCHSGPLMGGNSYQKMGRNNPYSNTTDKGLFSVTGKKEDMFKFKVPSMRNVALTGPYFHDGSASTLEEAVRQMAHLQLNKELTDDETAKIAAFLNALSDKNRKAIPNPEQPAEEVAPN